MGCVKEDAGQYKCWETATANQKRLLLSLRGEAKAVVQIMVTSNEREVRIGSRDEFVTGPGTLVFG